MRKILILIMLFSINYAVAWDERLTNKKQLCKCGCGKLTSGKWNSHTHKYIQYISGHQNKGKNNSMFGKKQTKETRRKLSEAKIGDKNPWYGKHLSKEHKRKVSLGNKGKIVSKETRRKMSITRKGKKLSEEHKRNISLGSKGRKPWNRGLTKETDKRVKEIGKKISISLIGKKHSEETKKKISLGNKGKPIPVEQKLKISKTLKETYKKRPELIENLKSYMGEKTSNWRGGKSFEPYGLNFNKKFRESIRERDNYTCQLCKKQKPNIKKLMVHHIDYIKTNNFTFNCITLCNSCHSITNFNREYWKTFFQNYLKDKYGYNNYIMKQKTLKEIL